MKKRPVLTPPVQRYHLGYFLARLLVSQGAKRFHRIDVLTGLENFPAKKRTHGDGGQPPEWDDGCIEYLRSNDSPIPLAYQGRCFLESICKNNAILFQPNAHL